MGKLRATSGFSSVAVNLLVWIAFAAAQNVRAQESSLPRLPSNARWIKDPSYPRASDPSAASKKSTIGRRVEFLKLPTVGQLPYAHRPTAIAKPDQNTPSGVAVPNIREDASEVARAPVPTLEKVSRASRARMLRQPAFGPAQSKMPMASEEFSPITLTNQAPKGLANVDRPGPDHQGEPTRMSAARRLQSTRFASVPEEVNLWRGKGEVSTDKGEVSADQGEVSADKGSPAKSNELLQLVFEDDASGLPTVPDAASEELPAQQAIADAERFVEDPDIWLDSNETAMQMSIEEVGRRISDERIVAERTPVAVSLQDVLVLALANSKNINVLRIQPAEDLQNVNREFGLFDWSAFVDTIFSQDAQPVGNVGQTNLAINQVRNDQNAVEVGLRKQTIYGGEISVSEILGTADSNSGLLDPEEPGNAQLRVTFTQELLRDRGRDVVLSQALIASLNADISHAQSFATISELLRDVLLQYWDLYQRRGDYFIQLSLIRWAEETLGLLESRGKIDAEQNSIEQARALLLEARANLENAKAAVLISQDELYRLVNAPQIDSNAFEILTVEEPRTTTQRYEVSGELQEALASRAEISQKLFEIRTAAVAHQVSLNQLLPRLTLSLQSSLNGIDDERDVFGAFSNMADVDPSYSAGLNFEIFLANRSARAQNKQAQLALRRLHFEYEDQIEQVRLDVATAIRTLNASTAILEQRYKTLQARLEEIEYLRIRRDVIPQQGVSPSLLLEQFFQAINRLVVSQQAYVAAVRDQQSALADLLQAKGILLDVSQVPRDIFLEVPSLRNARKEQRAGRRQFIDESYRRVVLPGRTQRLPTRR